MLIVGSGPGGGSLARWMGGQGGRIIVLEAGPKLRAQDLKHDSSLLIGKHFWEAGTRLSRGNALLTTMHGRALGGGSVFNAAICMRASETSLDRWADEHGTEGLLASDLADHYAAVEEFMGVSSTPREVWGSRNELFAKGCEELGWGFEPVKRNVVDCLGTGECFTGCRAERKQSTDRRGLPEFVASGGEIYTSVHVDRVVMRQGRVDGIEGYTVDPDTGERKHPVRIAARCTVLSAGPIGSPMIAQRGGLRQRAIGGNLRFHPSAFALGVMPTDIDPWFGATQGVHCLDFMDEGVKLESLWGPMGLFARRLPSAHKAFARYMGRWPRMVIFDGWISGDGSTGRVGVLPNGRPNLTYDIGKSDVRRLQECNAKLVELLFAAGAKEALPGISGLPEIMRAGGNHVQAIRDAKFAAHDFQSGSNHMFGTMAMGRDDGQHATDSWGKVYGVEDLYVCDTSLLPSSPAANPQLTAMALARRLAGELGDRYGLTATAVRELERA